MELKVSSNGQLVLANSTRDIFLSNVAIRNQGAAYCTWPITITAAPSSVVT